MRSSNTGEWYKDLDISSKGHPVGIDQIDGVLAVGVCYCVISGHEMIEQVDVYEDARRVHYKKFVYDDAERVIENRMYSPDGNGGWHVADDIWYYKYSPITGLRAKKIMRAPGAPTAREISYDETGNRVGEKTILL